MFESEPKPSFGSLVCKIMFERRMLMIRSAFDRSMAILQPPKRFEVVTTNAFSQELLKVGELTDFCQYWFEK